MGRQKTKTKSKVKARKSKKLTENQRAYKKQIDRLSRAVRELEKQGWVVDKTFLEKAKMPKARISKQAIDKLKRITRNEIRRESDLLNLITGELLAGEELAPAEYRKIVKINQKLLESEIEESVSEKEESVSEKEEFETEIEYSNKPEYIDILDKIRDSLYEMERHHPRPVPEFEYYKNALITAFDDNVMLYEMNNSLNELRDYYTKHSWEIFHEVDVLEYDSGDNEENRKMYYSFIHLMQILNAGTPLSSDDYENLEFQYSLERQ